MAADYPRRLGGIEARFGFDLTWFKLVFTEAALSTMAE